MRSIDKAYLRPGTSEGFIKTRNSRNSSCTLLRRGSLRSNMLGVEQRASAEESAPAAQEKTRKLPKYDWPESATFITPSTHRLFTQEPVQINGEEKLLIKNDRHFVSAIPKVDVPSTADIWGNETERLRLLYPDEFEVFDPETPYLKISGHSVVQFIMILPIYGYVRRKRHSNG